MCCLRWVRAWLLSVVQPKGSTPVNWWILAALYFSMFGNAVAAQMLFAFLPDMVKSFGIADEDAGYYVGLLASGMFFGRFISSYFWGWLCDKIGRRKVLLWCLFFLALTTFGFGFVQSFALAFIIRLLSGLFGGVTGTVKAALTEVCDESNQAFGMSIIVAAWNSGTIIGPAIGGYLARPAEKYSMFKEASVFHTFAFLLPCLVNTAILVIGFFLVFFKFPETLKSLKEKKEREALTLTINDSEENSQSSSADTSLNKRSLSKNSQSLNDLKSGSLSRKKSGTSIDIPQHLLSGSVSFLPDTHLYGFMHGSKSLPEVDRGNTVTYELPNDKPRKNKFSRVVHSWTRSKLCTLCRNRDVRYSIALYSVYSFAVIAENEIFSVWAASGKHLGGLEYDTNDLGFALMVVGVGTALSSCLLFPQTQLLMLSTAMFFTIICPATNILNNRGSTLKIAVICVLLIMRIAMGCCFTGQFLFIGNSVSSKYRATVHGLAMTATCGARSFAPTVAGSIFAWSITSGLGFPFNEKCVYIFLGFVLWLSIILACCLNPEKVSKPSD